MFLIILFTLFQFLQEFNVFVLCSAGPILMWYPVSADDLRYYPYQFSVIYTCATGYLWTGISVPLSIIHYRYNRYSLATCAQATFPALKTELMSYCLIL